MSLLHSRTSPAIGLALAALLLAGCIGPPVQVVPDDYSQGRTRAEVAADLLHCEEIAGEVLTEYGPHPDMSDGAFEAASTLRGYRTQYEAACMRAKGYQVKGSLGQEITEADLPASAVSKARTSASEGANE